MKKTYSLPGETCTTSGNRYIREWRKLAGAIERKLNVRVFAFDPGLAVCTSDGRESCDMPTWLAKKIAGMEDA